MKIRFQFNPALPAALLCAAGWFVFWLTAFDPIPIPAPPPPMPGPRPIALIRGEQPLRDIQSPLLFALPSAQGFSRTFQEDRIRLRPILEQPEEAARYLSRAAFSTPKLSRTSLADRTALPESILPAPGDFAPTVRPQPKPAEFFFDAALLPRVPEQIQLDLPSVSQSRTFRVHLQIREDGRVTHLFFDEAADNDALAVALYNLKFKPAPAPDEGWMELRLNPAAGGPE